MLDSLIDPFDGAIMQRALAESVLAGLACGPLGVWILLHRRSYAAESISHGMLPGLVVAALIGAPLLIGATAGALVAAAAMALAGRDERLGGDTGVAVAVTGLFGLGGVLALSPEVPPRIGELLFGDILGVTAGDLAAGAALVAGLLVALAAAHRRLALAAFDPAAARSLGSRASRSETVLLVLLALTTVAAVQALGNLLLVALILAPGAAALNLANRLEPALALAAGLAVLSGLGGLLASYHLDVAAGAAIALTAVGFFALSTAAARV